MRKYILALAISAHLTVLPCFAISGKANATGVPKGATLAAVWAEIVAIAKSAPKPMAAPGVADDFNNSPITKFEAPSKVTSNLDTPPSSTFLPADKNTTKFIQNEVTASIGRRHDSDYNTVIDACKENGAALLKVREKIAQMARNYYNKMVESRKAWISTEDLTQDGIIAFLHKCPELVAKSGEIFWPNKNLSYGSILGYVDTSIKNKAFSNRKRAKINGEIEVFWEDTSNQIIRPIIHLPIRSSDAIEADAIENDIYKSGALEPDPEQLCTWRELWVVCQKFLANLPQQQQEVFRLIYVEGWKAANVATHLATSVNNVHQITSRIRKKFFVIINPTDPESLISSTR
jgi:RNA polymerase sigma factor (sigma-70 family)